MSLEDRIYAIKVMTVAMAISAIIGALLVGGLLFATAPRSAVVIPSDALPTSVAHALSSDPRQTGAPYKDGDVSAGPSPSDPVVGGAPHPTGGIGEPASYAKPTAKPRLITHGGLGGWASFYDDGPGIYVALPGWTRDSPIRTVVVCANVGLWRCATANVWTSCGCHTNTDHPKIVDLSPDLMALITGWDRATMTNRGVVRVTVQEIP